MDRLGYQERRISDAENRMPSPLRFIERVMDDASGARGLPLGPAGV